MVSTKLDVPAQLADNERRQDEERRRAFALFCRILIRARRRAEQKKRAA
jgi:hypothetical protein